MEAQRYEDTGAMYMFDLQQKHDPVQEGAKELKRMITRSATLRAFWRRYTENNGIFLWLPCVRAMLHFFHSARKFSKI